MINFLLLIWLVPPLLALIVIIDANLRYASSKFNKSIVHNIIICTEAMHGKRSDRNICNGELLTIIAVSFIPLIGLLIIYVYGWPLLAHDSEIFNKNYKNDNND